MGWNFRSQRTKGKHKQTNHNGVHSVRNKFCKLLQGLYRLENEVSPCSPQFNALSDRVETRFQAVVYLPLQCSLILAIVDKR